MLQCSGYLLPVCCCYGNSSYLALQLSLHSIHPSYCSSVPTRQSCCQLEVDACIEDIINRHEAVRVPLDQATPDLQLVDSLVPMWHEERLRIGADIPPPPPSPPRTPEPLCPAVESVRAQLQVRICTWPVIASNDEAHCLPHCLWQVCQPAASDLLISVGCS